MKIVFFIDDEKKWDHLILQLKHLTAKPDYVTNIAVIAVDTSILSCLKNTSFDNFKATIKDLKSKNTEFYLCINTIHKYGIPEEMILDDFLIAKEGGLIKALLYQQEGFILLQS